MANSDEYAKAHIPSAFAASIAVGYLERDQKHRHGTQ
jgi:hypothetical protein